MTQVAVVPAARVIIMCLGAVGALILAKVVTGEWAPSDPAEAAVFQNALLLIVLGSAVIEHKFTKPADSVLNCTMGLITLLTVAGVAPVVWWWLVLGYLSIVLIISLTCVMVSTGTGLTGWQGNVSQVTYRIAVVFGKARVVFSILFLFAVFSHYGVGARETATLVVFWGLFIALWPLGVPELISALVKQSARPGTEAIGEVVRYDNPNLVRCKLAAGASWGVGEIRALFRSDGQLVDVCAIGVQPGQESPLVTGLLVGTSNGENAALEPNRIYDLGAGAAGVPQRLGGGESSNVVGFVVENSRIGEIRFECTRPEVVSEGRLLWSFVGKDRVHYQVVEGVTAEENLERSEHGRHIGVASQLGVFNAERDRYVKAAWVPHMNTPVFSEPENDRCGQRDQAAGDFVFGRVPGTNIEIRGAFADAINYHTAILGVTGSGKTELAFDLIRNAIKNNTKVVCVDLTKQYSGRLADLNPVDLSLSAELTEELGLKEFAVETGQFGGFKEKGPLKEFRDKLREDVQGTIGGFLEGQSSIGIITLEQLTNTSSTIQVTEMFLSAILDKAREGTAGKILVVLEEAHTVIPEASTMGLGDFGSKAIVAKIAQIALQGRKFGVGLLVVAQRTATVSKTVLTQCNTIVAFSAFDATAISYLETMVGSTVARALPDLGFLQAIVFGKAVRSDRPVIVEVPFKPELSEEREETEETGIA